MTRLSENPAFRDPSLFDGELFKVDGLRYRWLRNNTAAVGASITGTFSEPETGMDVEIAMVAVDEARVPSVIGDPESPSNRFVLWEVERDAFDAPLGNTELTSDSLDPPDPGCP